MVSLSRRSGQMDRYRRRSTHRHAHLWVPVGQPEVGAGAGGGTCSRFMAQSALAA